VKPGEALGIIGRNGAGKSTTLKVLNRILRPTRGRMEVRGRIGALIELAAGFHPDLTGRENVFLQGAVMGMRRSEIRERFDEIVEFAGIGDFIDTQVKRYSSGMNARLGFSIAAFLRPEVLLIDEVLAVGDLSFQQKCYGRLRQFKDEGLSICFVSHNMQAIAALCDRVAYLRGAAPPLVDSVSEAISAYLESDRANADPRVEVMRVSLFCGGQPLQGHEGIPPGSELRIDVELRARQALSQSGFGIVVQRADGLPVFDAISLVEGVPPVDLRADNAITFSVSLRVNLGRGIYSVMGRLVHSERLWPMVELGSLGSFVIEESKRMATIAELEPRFSVVSDTPEVPRA
jgi:lipopolysaccharide transport system ATP-binding protein